MPYSLIGRTPEDGDLGDPAVTSGGYLVSDRDRGAPPARISLFACYLYVHAV